MTSGAVSDHPGGFFSKPPARVATATPAPPRIARTPSKPPASYNVTKFYLVLGIVGAAAVLMLLATRGGSRAMIALLSVIAGVLALCVRPFLRRPLSATGVLLAVIGVALIVRGPVIAHRLTVAEVTSRADALRERAESRLSSAAAGASYELLANLEKGIVPANAVYPVWPWIVGGAASIVVGLIAIALDVTLRRQKAGAASDSLSEVTSSPSVPPSS